MLRFVLPPAWWATRVAKRPMEAKAVACLVRAGGGAVVPFCATLTEQLRAAWANLESSPSVRRLKESSVPQVVVLFEADGVSPITCQG